MDLHNDAVKALVYPPKEEKKDFKEESDDDDDDGDMLSRLLEDMGMDFWEGSERSKPVYLFIFHSKVNNN